jgi:hypothetical protein
MDKTIWIDQRDYFINEVSQILGILTMPFKAFYPTGGLSDRLHLVC